MLLKAYILNILWSFAPYPIEGIQSRPPNPLLHFGFNWELEDLVGPNWEFLPACLPACLPTSLPTYLYTYIHTYLHNGKRGLNIFENGAPQEGGINNFCKLFIVHAFISLNLNTCTL